MKHFSIPLFIITYCISMQANITDEYYPLLESDKVWILYTENKNDTEFKPYYTKAWVDRDTLIDNEEAKVIHLLKNTYDNTEKIRSVILKEKHVQVFYYQGYKMYDLPLFDFDCHEGETTIDSLEEDGKLVEEEGMLKLYGIDYRYLKINGHTWIEGIGSPDLYSLTVWPAPTCGPLPTTEMVECYKGDKLIFTKEEFRKSSGIISLETEEASSPIYDLHGREITNPQSGSIYIRDGKKFVAK